MPLTPQEQAGLLAQLNNLTPQQLAHVKAILLGFSAPITATLVNPHGSFITPCVVTEMGVRLMAHHSRSTQPMTKTIFEHALNDSLNACGVPSQMHKSGTNRGYDLLVNNVRVSLKSESSAVKPHSLHISKWMELGKGPWNPAYQHAQFLQHLQSYDQILTLRCLSKKGPVSYELVEIPKIIFSATAGLSFDVRPGKTPGQIAIPPASGYVVDASGNHVCELYHDGGGERKLQVRRLAKTACVVRATWIF